MAHESSNDLNTPMILVIGLVSSVATFAIILYLIGMYHSVVQSQYEEEMVGDYADPVVVQNRQMQSLREPEMIDAASGQVRLPIDDAMKLVISTPRDRERFATCSPHSAETTDISCLSKETIGQITKAGATDS